MHFSPLLLHHVSTCLPFKTQLYVFVVHVSPFADGKHLTTSASKSTDALWWPDADDVVSIFICWNAWHFTVSLGWIFFNGISQFCSSHLLMYNTQKNKLKKTLKCTKLWRQSLVQTKLHQMSPRSSWVLTRILLVSPQRPPVARRSLGVTPEFKSTRETRKMSHPNLSLQRLRNLRWENHEICCFFFWINTFISSWLMAGHTHHFPFVESLHQGLWKKWHLHVAEIQTRHQVSYTENNSNLVNSNITTFSRTVTCNILYSK